MRPFFKIICLLMVIYTAVNTIKAQDSMLLHPLVKGSKVTTSSLKYTPTGFLSAANKDSLMAIPVQSRLPLNFYSTHLGTACKMELHLEKQTGLPIRIRLGSKEQVDYLEGKFNRNR